MCPECKGAGTFESSETFVSCGVYHREYTLPCYDISMWKFGAALATVVAGTVVLPGIALIAETTCGGILVEEDYSGNGTIESGERTLDPFPTCEDRDDFATFFGRSLPNDVTITVDGETLSDGDTLLASPIPRPLLLSWANLPIPPEECGPFGDGCVSGLAIEVFHRTHDTFRTHWYGEYRASGVYGSPPWSMGQGYTRLTSDKLVLNDEGEYYLVVTHPEISVPTVVPEPRFSSFASMFKRFVPTAYAYDEAWYERQVVGGIRITVQGNTPEETTLSYPVEAPYDGVRGVASEGSNPERGLPTDSFTFKVVVVGAVGTHNITVSVSNRDTDTLVQSITMSTDTTAPEHLRDGDISNGEQYTATGSYPKGHYHYRFSAAHQGTTTLLGADTPPTFQVGYSSVAFIPGFQASTLSFTDPKGDTQEVWPPGFFDTPSTLQFTEEGTPRTNDTMYTDGLVERAYGLDIYDDFVSFMDGLVKDEHLITEWSALPYDWRYDVRYVARESMRISQSESYRLREVVEELADGSASGRVTLLTHSNGGLVGKALLRDMEREGSDALIDQLIMVAPPQLGTPKAIASVFHGEGQGIPFSFGPFLSNADARAIGRTLPGAYGLLPSRAYFDAVSDPVIVLEDGVLPGVSQGYDSTIDTFEELQAFMKGQNRNKPERDTTITPDRAIPALLSGADTLHDELDTWEPPAHVKVTTVVGWGLDTLKGVRYVGRPKRVCHDSAVVTPYCETVTALDYEQILTVEGDGTVVWRSARVGGEEVYFVNLQKFLVFGSTHADILGKREVQQLISRVLTKNETSSLPQGVTRTKQNPNDEASILRVSVHSPVLLSITRSAGGRVGTTPDGFIEQSIPGGYYFRFGEGQYAGVPKEGEYLIRLEGTATGTFTLIIDDVLGDTVVSSTTFKDVPVTERMSATLNIVAGAVQSLNVDSDGNGTVDSTVQSTQSLSFNDHLRMFEQVVTHMTAKKPVKVVLLVHAATLKHLHKKGRLIEAKRLIVWLNVLVSGLVRHRAIVPDEGAQLLTVLANTQQLIGNN